MSNEYICFAIQIVIKMTDQYSKKYNHVNQKYFPSNTDQLNGYVYMVVTAAVSLKKAYALL